MACGITIAPSAFGSGKFVEPWARMHRENLSAAVTSCEEPSLARVGRERALADALRGVDQQAADTELMRSQLGLIELTVAVGSGPKRYTMSTHALGEDKRLGVDRRRG
jgi:hypothetical protein